MTRPGIGTALAVELLKARRSKVPLLVALGISLAPIMAGLFMVIMEDPARARGWGIISTKAQIMAGSADWPTYLGLLAQSVAIGGFILFSIVTAWVFGREFSDRTVKTLLALPTPRHAIVVAKLLAISILSLLFTAWVLALGVAIGAAIGLPDGRTDTLVSGAGLVSMVGILTVLLLTPIAFAASAGRGYMAPLGLALFLVFLGQILAAAGWGEWFPWAVPPLLAGAAGPEAALIGPRSYALLLLVSLAGTASTLAWWQRADHTT